MMTTTTSSRAGVLARAALTLIVAATSAVIATGCAADEPCEAGECGGGGGEGEVGQEGPTGGGARVGPVICRRACRALFGECGTGEPLDPYEKGGYGDCTAWCVAGGLTESEASCLAEAGCGGEVDGCFTE
ncbi:MAG TPA: hypothetical protein VKZ63_14395 [Kofleriaceae bacterium]|nr:hypothetical protein [Kofleriaceae bacterium]